jgi:hypothetical protein
MIWHEDKRSQPGTTFPPSLGKLDHSFAYSAIGQNRPALVRAGRYEINRCSLENPIQSS